jgi:hypothetical protein
MTIGDVIFYFIFDAEFSSNFDLTHTILTYGKDFRVEKMAQIAPNFEEFLIFFPPQTHHFLRISSNR